MAINKVYRKLPTRYNITEVKFTGDKFSQKRITHEIEKIRTRIPNKRIQVLLPYENWKPGSWFEDKESLFSLLDHYDESQIPEGGCNPKKDNGLNDCFYQCLYYAYGTFSKMPKVIKKPEMLKKVLGLQRNDLILVSFIEKVEKIVKTIAINIIGDVTILSKSKAYRKITLVLANGHYTLAKNLKRIETKSGTTKIKKPLIYQKNRIKNIVTLYDGKSFKTTTIPELRKLQSKHYGSYKKVALWLFELLSKAVPANEPLNPIEAQWISNTMLGEEKYKTPYPVTNITNLIINSNNSKTIRLDREDRRYFIPDISNKYVENGIGMDHYYAPLDKVIKNPEVGKAFYLYALEYVKLNPNFDERKIPMTKTKLMMINRDNNPVYQFIKEKYIYNSIGLDLASSYFYNIFKDWFYIQINTKNKKPPTIQEFTYTIRELGLNSKQKRVGE
ncbi:hypothetical protein Glove_469g4 [Diversispora epigaea]|uniref:Uncharacterized protein n=1 Tax=Diversispora epigaea TaxID=1348612 RepID=A0A397GQW1_9GLOM|nr:hypothetical protein Glove_469g4 [Diversispora epigaea]